MAGPWEAYGGTTAPSAPASEGPWAAYRPASEAIAERSDVGPAPENAMALRAGLEAAAKARNAPETSSLQRIAIDFNNQQAAAGQRTTPNVAAYGQPISANVHENDAGELLYVDPATDQLVRTDQNKHVILRDPKDNTLKVYNRGAKTDEGALSAAGRLLGTGLATGAPTARASAVAVPVAEVAQELKPGQQVVAAAERLSQTGSPVQVPRAIATDSMATQRAAAVARNVPLAGDPLVKSAERTISQLGAKASEVAEGYGGATVAGAGETARDSIRNYITGQSAATSKKFYDRVDELINPTVTTRLDDTYRVARDIEGKRELAHMGESEATNLVLKAVMSPEGLTYEGIKTLRTSIGEMLNGGVLPANTSQGELKQIYGALSKDLKSAVQNAGGNAASVAFDRANKHYALLSDRREALAKIIGKDGNAPAEQVFERLVSMASSSGRADIERLAKARKAMGAEDWNEFVSGIVGRMGRDTAALSGPEKVIADGFSPQRFLTAYGKLSDAGKSMLFRSGGKAELANHLDDIARVSTRFKELMKFANPSGTGQVAIGGGIGAGLMADPLTTIGTVIGGRMLASALARPASAASVAKWSRANEALARNPSPATIGALNVASRNLINTLGVKEVSPTDFLRALQGPVPGRAEDEKQ